MNSNSLLRGLLTGIITVIITVMTLPTMVFADQFLKAADNATLSGVVSRVEVTRISFTGDDVASLQKIKPANPLDDFSVAHDAVTGDIYVTLPTGYSSKFVNFFATSKRGYTYKFVLRVSDIPATQIFVQNPAVASDRAMSFERAQPYRQTLVRLMRAMWNREVLPGFKIKWRRGHRIKAGPLKYREVGTYNGNGLVGQVYEVHNKSRKPVHLSEAAFETDNITSNILAISLQTLHLAPKAKTIVFIIASKQGGHPSGKQ